MTASTRKPRVSFEPTEEQWERIKQLPREVNMTKEMRGCLDKLLAKSLTKTETVKV